MPTAEVHNGFAFVSLRATGRHVDSSSPMPEMLSVASPERFLKTRFSASSTRAQ
jgi:hypothetical protein